MQQILSVLEFPLFLASHYLVLLGLLATAWVVGRSALSRVEHRDELMAGVTGTALGLGLLGTAFMLLALVGLFRPVPVLLVAAACHLVWRARWVEAAEALRDWSARRLPLGYLLPLALILVLLAPLTIVAIYPPTEFDALMFHLPLADSIAQQGKIDFFHDLRFPVFPALQEVLYAAVLLFSDDIAPSLVHYACYLLVAVLLFCWGRWLSSWRTGAWAALLWLGVPAALRTAVGAYVDCGLTLYVATAIFCLHRYARRGDRDWLMAAGALVAFGAATKYHGLFFLVLLSVGVVLYTSRRRRFRHLGAYGLAAAACALPWYGFIYFHTGNPIFPFFPGVFGLSPWAFELRSTVAIPSTEVDTGLFSLAAKIVLLFKMLWNKVYMMLDRNPLTLARLPLEIFDPGNTFRGDRLSPVFALAAPLMAVMMFRFRRARYFMFVALSYLVIWAATAKDMRYVLVVLPLFALTGAEATDRLIGWLAGKSWRGLTPLLAIVVTAPLLLQVNQLASRTIWTTGRPPIRPEQRERFLTSRLRPYAAIQVLNERFGSDYVLYGLFCENIKHFAEGRHLGDWFGPDRYARIFSKLQNPEALHHELNEMGAKFLLVPDLNVWKQKLADQFPLPSQQRLASHFEVFYQDKFNTVFRLLPPKQIARLQSQPARTEAAEVTPEGAPPDDGP